MLRVVHLLLPISMVSLAQVADMDINLKECLTISMLFQGQGVHFFGPPAVGFGVGLVSVHRF